MRENYCVAFLATDFVSLAPRWIYITRYTGHLNIRTLEVSAHITFLLSLSRQPRSAKDVCRPPPIVLYVEAS